MNQIPVRDFMQRDPVTARPDMPLRELVSLLREDGRRGLPVTEDGRRLVGVVSETDLFLKEHPVPFSTEKVPSLLGKVIDKNKVDEVARITELKVKDVMTAKAATVSEDTTLGDVALLMHERHLSMVPVVAGDRLVGVVRRSDVLAILYREER